MSLRKTGIEWVMKGQTQFMTKLATVNKATDTLQNKITKLSKSPISLSGKSLRDLIPKETLENLKTFSTKFKGLGDLATKALPQISALSMGFGGLSTQVLGAVGKLNIFVAAAAAATIAIVSLGMRGAAMPGIIEAFDFASQKAGILSTVLLNDLRDASRGTVSDMALMRQANVGLAGAGGQLAQALGPGKGLAGLLNIARAQARATGQSVDFLYESLVSGIKRATPMLIDNTGLVLKVGEANESYAKSIGKTVEQLTAEEKQIALLNATLAAGKSAVETYGQGALQASERIAQINVLIANTLDRAALAVQPIFNVLLEVAHTILEAIVAPLNTIIIPIFRELANTIFGPVLQAFMLFKSGVGDLLAPAAELIHRWMVIVIGVIRGVGWAFSWVVKSISNLLAPVKDIIKKYLVEPITKFLDPVQFARRGGMVIGALAEGFLWAANTLVFPAVIEIATFIADFLMGFSPPKRGPLSTIDEGGANVMRAWLVGFTGVSLTPVKDMAAAVAGELGTIGRLTHEQAQARLDALDRQLQPYLDMLELAKARVEEIASPLKSLQDATQKMLARQLEAFTKGLASAEAVRGLDSQNAQLTDRLDLLQSMTDEAEYQASLKQSEQAMERAMLAIQLRRVKPVEKLKEETEKLSEAAGSKAGSGQSESEAAAAGGGITPLVNDAVGGFLGVTDDEIKQMWADLKGGFSEGIGDGAKAQLATFKSNAGTLKTQMDRIGKSQPFQKLTDGFNSVFGDDPDSLRGKLGGFVDEFTSKWDGLWGDSGSVMGTWNTFKGNLTGGWDSLFGEAGTLRSVNTETITGIFTGLFGEGGKSSQALEGFETKWQNLWKYPDGGLWTTLSGFSDQVSTLMTETIPGYFDSFSLAALEEKFKLMFLTPDAGIGWVWAQFKGVMSRVWDTSTGWVAEQLNSFSLDNIKAKFSDFFSEGGTASQILNTFVDTMKNIFKPESGGILYDLLSGVGGFLATLIGAPIEGIVNAVLDAMTTALNTAIGLINDAIKAYNSIPLAPDISEMPLINAPPQISIIPKAKKGGFFGSGLVNVHAGETMVAASSRYAVFPKEWVQVMSRLSNAMAPARTAGGGSVSNVDNSRRSSTVINANFTGGASRRNFQMQLAELRGWSG